MEIWGREACARAHKKTRASVDRLHALSSLFFSSYCTKKLRRLYRNLKLSHGRGKYQKRALDAATVTEEG